MSDYPDNNDTMPICSIDIFDLDGNQIAITNPNILACTVSQSIFGAVSWTATLAPGGPTGIIGTSWAQIITPMALVVIAMSRGTRSNVVMVGLVTSTTETQHWQGGRVLRAIQISGTDFGYFFKQSYYMWMEFYTLGLLGANELVSQPNLAILPPQLNVQGSNGDPGTVAFNWFQWMTGPNGGMADTHIAGPSILPLSQVLGYHFDELPAYINLLGANQFLSTDDTWDSKFRKIIPYPWYEFFTVTAPSTLYQSTLGDSHIGDGTNYTSTTMPWAVPSQPQVIGRINPLPVLTASSSAFTGLDVDLWNTLSQFALDSGTNFMSSTMTFNCNEVRNFYQYFPTYFNLVNETQNNPQQIAANIYPIEGDVASAHRYGLRPSIYSGFWMANTSDSVNTSTGDPDTAFANVTARMASMAEPTPNMARSTTMVPLRPDIFPGQQWSHIPFRDTVPWTFYVETVSHSFAFGGVSSTSLQLSRGLPTAVYADSGLLYQMHLGNAQRLNGQYQAGTPAGLGTTLQVYPTKNGTMASFIQNLTQGFTLPQKL